MRLTHSGKLRDTGCKGEAEVVEGLGNFLDWMQWMVGVVVMVLCWVWWDRWVSGSDGHFQDAGALGGRGTVGADSLC